MSGIILPTDSIKLPHLYVMGLHPYRWHCCSNACPRSKANTFYLYEKILKIKTTEYPYPNIRDQYCHFDLASWHLKIFSRYDWSNIQTKDLPISRHSCEPLDRQQELGDKQGSTLKVSQKRKNLANLSVSDCWDFSEAGLRTVGERQGRVQRVAVVSGGSGTRRRIRRRRWGRVGLMSREPAAPAAHHRRVVQVWRAWSWKSNRHQCSAPTKSWAGSFCSS